MGAQDTRSNEECVHTMMQCSSVHNSSPSVLMPGTINGACSPIEYVFMCCSAFCGTLCHVLCRARMLHVSCCTCHVAPSCLVLQTGVYYVTTFDHVMDTFD